MEFKCLTILFVVVVFVHIDGRGKLKFFTIDFIFLFSFKVLSNDEFGRISENRFINDEFHLSVEIPTNWTVATRKEMEKGYKPFDSDHLIIPVFGFTQHSIGSPLNPNIVALAVKKDFERDLCTPIGELRNATTLLHPSMKQIGECREVTINKMNFTRREFSTMIDSSTTLHQILYNYHQNDESLISFTLTYFNTKEQEILDRVMQSLSFSLSL